MGSVKQTLEEALSLFEHQKNYAVEEVTNAQARVKEAQQKLADLEASIADHVKALKAHDGN